MKHIFSHKTYPSLRRDLLGFSFDIPVALEPTPVYRPSKWAVGGSRYAFVEIGPVTDGTREIGFKKPSSLVVASNISNMQGRTAAELSRSITASFSKLYDFADLFVLDTFRPDSDNVVVLQNADVLSEVMDSLLESRRFYDSAKPILVRVSPSISQTALQDIIHYLRMSDADGIIAGYDCFSPELVTRVYAITGGRFPLIACGGINNPAKADEILKAGADMIQISRYGTQRIIKHLEKTAAASETAAHKEKK